MENKIPILTCSLRDYAEAQGKALTDYELVPVAISEMDMNYLPRDCEISKRNSLGDLEAIVDVIIGTRPSKYTDSVPGIRGTGLKLKLTAPAGYL